MGITHISCFFKKKSEICFPKTMVKHMLKLHPKLTCKKYLGIWPNASLGRLEETT